MYSKCNENSIYMRNFRLGCGYIHRNTAANPRLNAALRSLYTRRGVVRCKQFITKRMIHNVFLT